MYLILILTHKNNLTNVYKKEWLKKLRNPYLILYGDNNIENDYLYKSEKNELVVKCPDTYEYITLKLACAYKFIVTEPEMNEINGIFKVDDDVVLNIDEFVKYTSDEIKDDYTGHLHLINENTKCEHHKNKVMTKALNDIVFNFKLSYVCYGPMYYLSKRALMIIVSKFSYHNFNIYSTQLFEDYTFANILADSNIKPKCIPMYTDHLDQFTSNLGFIAFHDSDHTKDILNIDNLINC
jgi:hypothetical protein